MHACVSPPLIKEMATCGTPSESTGSRLRHSAFLGLASFGHARSPAAAAVTEAQALAAAQTRRAVDRLAAGIRRRSGLLRRRLVDDRPGVGGHQRRGRAHLAAEPSAQDFYLSAWTSEGPGGAATDDERAILAGYAGGLETSRLDAQHEPRRRPGDPVRWARTRRSGRDQRRCLRAARALDVNGAPSEVMGDAGAHPARTAGRRRRLELRRRARQLGRRHDGCGDSRAVRRRSDPSGSGDRTGTSPTCTPPRTPPPAGSSAHRWGSTPTRPAGSRAGCAAAGSIPQSWVDRAGQDAA